MTVTETIRCPGCSTRFALRPERVHPRIRRARCFRCDTTFDIAEAVQRLFGEGVPEPAAQPPIQPAPPVPEEAASTLKMPVVGEPAVEIPVQAVPEPAPEEAPAPFEPGEPPSLTLGDLEGSEDEILEKTLVIDPPPLPDQAASEEAEAGGGFSSAKDAVAKLMGNAPAAPPHAERRQLGSRGPMDVEATLSALEDTLGGNRPLPPPPEPAPAPRSPAAASSTLKLTAEEIQAAMATLAPTPGSQPPLPPAPAFQPPSFAPPVPPRTAVPPPPRPLDPPTTSQGPDLLKIQMEQETLDNVSIDQISTWIAQGRVHEYHMVARQFSDHWIEASKVPALRPAFDRLRRESGAAPEPISPPPELPPARRSLFGGLFGRN